MSAMDRLIATILTPSTRDEDGYQWAVIGIGHVMLGAALQGLLGAALQGLLGAAGVAARLMIAVVYWLVKERGDLSRGGSLRDGLVDTALVGVGTFYAGPRWWPVAVMLTIALGAILKERSPLKPTEPKVDE